MEMVSIKLINQPMRGVGLMGKKMEKAKLFIKVELYFKGTLKMERNMVLGKCTTNHQVTILKDNGHKIKKKEMEL